MRAILSFVAVSIALCLAGPGGADASEFENSGLYVALDAGVVLQPKPFEVSVAIGSAQLGAALSMSPGFAVGGRLGYKFRPGWRIEGEVAYRRNTYDTLDLSGVGTIGGVPVNGAVSLPVEGNNAALLYMVNVYYEFAIADRWLPYAGLGIGGVTTFFDLSGNSTASAFLDVDNRTRFGFQLGAGLGFAINPKTVVSLDYRYLESVEPENVFGSIFGLGYDYRSHGILVGIRRHF